MKSPVPYFGSKQSVASWITSLMPEHEHYVEPFCGSLSVLLAKRPAPMETVNDLDGELMLFWRILRDRPDDLIRVCALTPHGRAEMLAAHEPATDELEQARRVWVRLSQSLGGQLRKNGWRHYVDPARKGGFGMPKYLDGYVDRMAAAAERLHAVSLECMPALDVIGKYGRCPEVLLYVDPPYLGATREATTRYRHELKTEQEHRNLADALTDCKAAVVLSGYDSPLYDQLYEGWHRYAKATTTGNGKGDKTRTEVLWANRPLGDQIHLFSEVSA